MADIIDTPSIDQWVFICERLDHSASFRKITSALQIDEVGCLVSSIIEQTENGHPVSNQTMCYVPGVKIVNDGTCNRLERI